MVPNKSGPLHHCALRQREVSNNYDYPTRNNYAFLFSCQFLTQIYFSRSNGSFSLMNRNAFCRNCGWPVNNCRPKRIWMHMIIWQKVNDSAYQYSGAQAARTCFETKLVQNSFLKLWPHFFLEEKSSGWWRLWKTVNKKLGKKILYLLQLMLLKRKS